MLDVSNITPKPENEEILRNLAIKAKSLLSEDEFRNLYIFSSPYMWQINWLDLIEMFCEGHSIDDCLSSIGRLNKNSKSNFLPRVRKFCIVVQAKKQKRLHLM